MPFGELINDDDAVSPVIGVILMVAITVILAAVIGAFVLGFGGGQSSAPTADFTSSFNDSGNQNVTFVLQSSSENLEVDNLNCAGASSGMNGSPSGSISAGNSVDCKTSGGSGTVNLAWNGSDTSAILAEHDL